MDLKSTPGYIEEAVTDVDVQFTFGQTSQMTLKGRDKVAVKPTTLVVTRESGEVVTMHRAHILWYGIRARIQRTPKTPVQPSSVPR